VLSWLLHSLGVAVQNPSTGKVVTVVNLLSLDGLHRALLDPVKNLLAYPPLSISLFCLRGIGIAEVSVLMGACLRLAVLASPAQLITPMEVLAGVLPNAGSEVGFITPLMIHFPLIVTFAQSYEPKAGIGKKIATMLPYSLWFTLAWTALLIVWIALSMPKEPGAPLFLAK
jgi:aminobenzoyl-glutamate transport protein